VLGHGGGAHAKDLSPRLIEVLVGKKVVGVATGFKSHCVDRVRRGLHLMGMESSGMYIWEARPRRETA